MNGRPDDLEPETTALSTLSARVAVLERWMRGSQRRQTALVILASLFFILSLALLLMR